MSSTQQSRALRDAAAVEPLSPGRFSVELSEHYAIDGHPNGGYLQTVMASGALAGAAEAGSHHVHATAVTTNYMGGPAVGPAELRAEVRRVGRGVSFVHVTLLQDDVVTTESLVTLGTLRDDSVPHYQDAPVPPVAERDQCLGSNVDDEINFRNVIDVRLDPQYAMWTSVSSTGAVRCAAGFVSMMATHRGIRGACCWRLTPCRPRRSHWDRRVGFPRSNSRRTCVVCPRANGCALANGASSLPTDWPTSDVSSLTIATSSSPRRARSRWCVFPEVIDRS